jgi:hypothetical protein
LRIQKGFERLAQLEGPLHSRYWQLEENSRVLFFQNLNMASYSKEGY